MSQKKRKSKPQIDQAQYDGIKAAFLKFNPDQENKEAVRTACQELVKAGHNRAYILKAAKELTGFGFNQQQISPPKEGKAAPGVEKGVEKKVTAEIAREATLQLHAVLATGKNLEDALGPIARFYGFGTTADFVLGMFTFWDTWHDHVEALTQDNEQLRWALNEIVTKFTPEARKTLQDQAVKDLVFSTIIMGQQTGKFPPPETMRGYIQVLKEEMKK